MTAVPTTSAVAPTTSVHSVLPTTGTVTPITPTTTSVPETTTSPPATAASTVPPSTTTIPPATTVAAPPLCATQQYMTQATTDRSAYAKGETVTITVSMTNSGPTCTGTTPGSCGLSASVESQSGNDVWDSGAGADNPPLVLGQGCPTAESQTIPHGDSTNRVLQWKQDQCSFDPSGPPQHPNPDCPGTQVPDGTYTVTAPNPYGGAIRNSTITVSG